MLNARAGERTLYLAARCDPHASPLVQALISEQRILASMDGRLGRPGSPAATAAQAAAISATGATRWTRRTPCWYKLWSIPAPAWPPSLPAKRALQAASARHDAPLAGGNGRHGAYRPVRQLEGAPAQRAGVIIWEAFAAPADPALAAAAAITGFLPRRAPGRRRLPPGMLSGYEPARNGLAGCEECEHPARWPSLTTAPHSSQTRHAQQAGSPPSSACPDPAGNRAWRAACRGSAADSLGRREGWSLVIFVPP